MRSLLVVALLAACQGSSSAPAPAPAPAPKVIDATAVVASDAGEEAGSGSGSASGSAGGEEPELVTIADLGAISAWQAVIDRARYLGRRGQHGVVYGTLGPAYEPPPPPPPPPGTPPPATPPPPPPPPSIPTTWLVDDTEGNGSLGIRVALGAKATGLVAGDRVAIGGAWELDDAKRWYWKAARVDKLPALDPSKSELKDPKPAIPSHVVANGELPSGARSVGVAKDNDAIYFTVVGQPPTTDGDGWAIADELGNPTAALLNLPGEHASYGAQDLRTAEERWSLRRGWQYWVRIGKVRKKDGKPASMNARTAPIRVK